MLLGVLVHRCHDFQFGFVRVVPEESNDVGDGQEKSYLHELDLSEHLETVEGD